MAPYWDALRFSIRLQPIPATLIHIRPGERVDSPYGMFLVQDVFLAEDNTTHMCSGLLIGWLGNDSSSSSGRDSYDEKKVPKATLQLDVLRRNITVPYLCYDCENKGVTKFHFLGLECTHCRGFNTVRI